MFARRFMESFNVRGTCIVTMNRFAKPRRSAMSIAANAPGSFPKLRRSGMFARRFTECFNVRGTCIGTMNRFAKLRRSAMSIAANAPGPSPSSVGAACSPGGSRSASTVEEPAL